MSALMARRPSRNYPQAPAGLHQAVCVDVQNLGLIHTTWGQKHKVRIVWQLGLVDEEHGRRYDVARLYTLSLHERAALRKDLESWRGRKFTEIELSQGFDLERLVGVPAQVQVTHDLSDDGTLFANVSTVVPPAKGGPRLVPQDYVRAKDRQPRPGAPPAAAPDEDPVPF